MGAYWAAVPKYHDASGRMTPQEAHNDYLEVLASGGLVAAALVAWFAVVVFRRTKENVRLVKSIPPGHLLWGRNRNCRRGNSQYV